MAARGDCPPSFLTRGLIQAASRGDLKTIKGRVLRLFRSNGQVNKHSLYCELEPLFKESVTHGHMEVLQFLCDEVAPDVLTVRSKLLSDAAARFHKEQSSSEHLLHVSLGLTPLMAAAAASDIKYMLLLINHRADVNVTTKHFDMTALVFAAHGDVHAIELLLDAGARDGPVDAMNQALHIACSNVSCDSDVRRIELLVKARADVNNYDGNEYRYQWTPLTRLAELNKDNASRCASHLCRAASVLLLGGADADRVTTCPLTKTQFAVVCSCGNLPLIRTFVEAGADLDKCGNNSPLICALISGHAHVAAYLIEQGANVHDIHVHIPEPASVTYSMRYLQCFKIVADAGADVSRALQTWACSVDADTDILDFLLDECGLLPQLDAPSHTARYSTPMSRAWEHEDINSAQRLLTRGADIDAALEDYGNAVFQASFAAHTATVKFLSLRGANIFAKSKCWRKLRCALDFAGEMRLSRHTMLSWRERYICGLVDALCEALAHRRDIRHRAPNSRRVRGTA